MHVDNLKSIIFNKIRYEMPCKFFIQYGYFQATAMTKCNGKKYKQAYFFKSG